MSARFIAGLAALLALGSAAHAQETVREKLERDFGEGFSIHKTEHWLIAHSTTDERARLVGESLERVRAEFVRTFESIGFEIEEPGEPLVFVVYGSRESFDEYMRRRVRPVEIMGSGLYSPRTNRVSLIVPRTRRRSGDSSLINLVVHEGTHQIAFNLGVLNRRESYPPWFGEGLASTFETRSLEGEFGPLTDSVSRRLAATARMVAEDRAMPLEELLALQRPSESADPEERQLARAGNLAIYGQGASLVTYLIRERPEQMKEYIDALERLPRFRDPDSLWHGAFEAAFGEVDEFERAWKTWLAGLDGGRR
ncbi:MAG: DUF1570 domain-containing protein [Armatimonadetes bacterium]|nr:DUF1570 domain-containing protein [Armatimonadota bacterium]